MQLGNQRYVVADIDAFLRRVEGLDDVAGIVGLEWFVRMPIKIDYARSRLTLFDPAQFKGAATERACRSPRAAAFRGCAAASTASTACSKSTWAAADR